MRFNASLFFFDTALPVAALDGKWYGKTADCSGASFCELFDRAWEATVAQLPYDAENITCLDFAAERFPHYALGRGEVVIAPYAWSRVFDAVLHYYMRAPASAIRVHLEGGLTAQAALKQLRVAGAVEGSAAAADIDDALAMLKRVKARQHRQIPGTRNFTDYNGDSDAYDCLDDVAPWDAVQPAGGLLIVKVKIRKG